MLGKSSLHVPYMVYMSDYQIGCRNVGKMWKNNLFTTGD